MRFPRCYQLSVAWIFFLIFNIRYSNIPYPSHLHRRPLFFCTAATCTALCFSSYLLTCPSDSCITFLCAKCMLQQKIQSSVLPKLLPRFRSEETKQDNATPGVLRDTSFFSRTVCSVLIVCKEKAETYAEIDQLLLLMYIHGEKNDSPRIPRSFVTAPVLERHLFWMVSLRRRRSLVRQPIVATGHPPSVFRVYYNTRRRCMLFSFEPLFCTVVLCTRRIVRASRTRSSRRVAVAVVASSSLPFQ